MEQSFGHSETQSSCRIQDLVANSSAGAKSLLNHGARTAADFFNGLAHHSFARKTTNDIVARVRAECRHIQQERASRNEQTGSLV